VFGVYVTHAVLPFTVGPLVIVPLVGPHPILATCTSPVSTSVNGTHTSIGVSSGVVTVVSGTTGGSFTGGIFIIITPVSHKPPLSHTTIQILSLPL
jgi:hypothetical protein